MVKLQICQNITTFLGIHKYGYVGDTSGFKSDMKPVLHGSILQLR